MVEIEGHPVSTPADRIALPLRSVTPGYFALLGLPIVDGRDFRPTDDSKAPAVAVVNRALADRYLGGSAAAVGKRLWMRGRGQPQTLIVGVASNARTADLTQAPSPEIYLSFWQATPFSKDLVVRTAGDPRVVIESVTRAMREVDPTVAVEHVKTLGDIRSDSLATRVFTTRLLVGFAIIGTLLTVVGIYGVLALSVAARQREIAIRVAIGARRRDIGSLVACEAVQMVAAGVAIGALGALAGARVLQSLLFEVAPTDAVTLVVAASLFVFVSLLASWLPIRRATAIDPMEALRCE
jgi:putative ABC transport system permease protein